ncbi:hypothetical protein [Piscirickettsia litoralis]|nr:hypothetical protein [Piscirickettsia litoralis]
MTGKRNPHKRVCRFCRKLRWLVVVLFVAVGIFAYQFFPPGIF